MPFHFSRLKFLADLRCPGRRMVREHARWLTRAVKSLRGKPLEAEYPRIPVRKVSEGGFAKLSACRSGRKRAERWWEKTLEKLPG